MASFGKYTTFTPLRITFFSDIFICRDDDLMRPVVVKVFHPKSGDALQRRDHWRQRFIAEAQTLASFDHPHIIRVMDSGTGDNGEPYYVMPFMPSTLRSEIGRDHPEHDKGRPRGAEPRSGRAMGLDRAISVWRQVLMALSAVHSKGIVHRDVKPGNLLLDKKRRGDIKLCDFGMASIPGHEVVERPDTVGTHEYRSPELVHDPAEAGARADVYAAGVLLMRLLTGNLLSAVTDIATAVDRKVPPDLVELLIACVDPMPQARPDDSIVLLARLDTIIDQNSSLE